MLEEAEQEHKRWLEEFKNFEEAEILLLFGSAARKAKTYNDVDILIVLTQENFPQIKKRIEEKNKKRKKKVRTPLYVCLSHLPNTSSEELGRSQTIHLSC